MDDLRVFVGLLADGHTLAYAGAAVGLSQTAAHRRATRFARERRRKPQAEPDVRREIRTLRMRGYSIRAIAVATGVGLATVHRWAGRADESAHHCRGCGHKITTEVCIGCRDRRALGVAC